ncbi:unnamed protein product [Echinostoma caproni]|uniref:RHD domain-containing protein n=1 Tax=Echinostoma caproni TaxID=27848 RepID=A0A183AQY8_9TREM|nr:unnamed protein product [Echinostoma caproni]
MLVPMRRSSSPLGFINLPVSSVSDRAEVGCYDIVYSNVMHQSRNTSRESLQSASMLSPPSTSQLTKNYSFSTEQCSEKDAGSHSISRSIIDPGGDALGAQENDSLFDNTMRVLLQSNVLSLDPANTVFCGECNTAPDAKEPLTDSAASKRQKLTPCNSCSTLLAENDEDPIENNDRTTEYLAPRSSIQLESHMATNQCTPSGTTVTLVDEPCPSELLPLSMGIAAEASSCQGATSTSDSCSTASHMDPYNVNVAFSSTEESSLPISTISQDEEAPSLLTPVNETQGLSAQTTPQLNSDGQLVVTKGVRFAPLYSRNTTSVARVECSVRECPGPLSEVSSNASVLVRRPNSNTQARDQRTAESQSRHSLLSPTVSSWHTNRLALLSATRTTGAGFRASLVQCSTNARKRSNRCAGLVNPFMSGPTIGVNPCVRRKCASYRVIFTVLMSMYDFSSFTGFELCYQQTAAYRNIASYYPHASLPRSTASSCGMAPIVICPDSTRSTYTSVQLADSNRSHPGARTPTRKFTSTTNPVARRQGNSAVSTCRTANTPPTKSFLSPPSPHQAFVDYSTINRCHIRVVNQPETQHRARYQTEGSRGAVKDRTGSGYPAVQLESIGAI